MRYFIPAIEEYSILAVNTVPFRISGDFYNTTKIISPVTRDDAETIEQYDKKGLFIESIVKRSDYKELLSYTFAHHKEKDKHKIEEIDNKYKELIGEYYDEINLNRNDTNQ